MKKNTPEITWTRLENLALPGVPDLLGYNKHQHFFTVELKVTRSNKIRFSPHQIAFHVQHPKNTFILVKSLDTRDWKLLKAKILGSLLLAACRLQLAARGLLLAAWSSLRLVRKLDACCLKLVACKPNPDRVAVFTAPVVVKIIYYTIVLTSSSHTSPHNNRLVLSCQ